jgi:hypothetical protein
MKYLILLVFCANAFAGAVGDNTGTHDVGLGNATPNYMPFVDRSKYLPWKGWKTRGTNEIWVRKSDLAKDIAKAGINGEFRIDCDVSHMSNDDPILYPGQSNAAHSHTFLGNTSTFSRSSATSLMAKDKRSTCRGGAANKSAYWVPSMIDTETGTPLAPKGALWYYKSGSIIDGSKIQVPPNGLKIIAGNPKATSPQPTQFPAYNCRAAGDNSGQYVATKNLPACAKGGKVVYTIAFPQCWDGKNLDSPDHISHMANPSRGSCPATHPVPIPHLSLNVYYDVTSDKGTEMWRLASDNYPKNGYNAGYSLHADWIAAWHTPTITKIVKQCLNKKLECGNSLLGFTEGVGHEIIYKRCNINGVVRDC